MRSKQEGFHIIELSVALIIVAILLVTGWFVLKGGQQETAKDNPTSNNKTQSLSDEQLTAVQWAGTDSGWLVAEGTPPKCEDPIQFTPPADVFKASSILYPGQTRGTYKPHGGFRFDSLGGNEVEVRAPSDGVVVRGAQYLVNGEVQYTFDFIHPCGIMQRLGHLRELSPAFAKLADKLPAPAEGDSRTVTIDPGVIVREGDLIATKVGTIKDTNVFFDWGVYDLRQNNPISSNSGWAADHQSDKELSWHAVCWFNMLPEAASDKVKELPSADKDAGKRSDYCTQ